MEVADLNWYNSQNILFMSPFWPAEVQKYFRQRFEDWIFKNPGQQNLIFIATSGTTSKDLTRVKFAVLRKEAIFNSARSVGQAFNFSSSDRVALTLPIYHVGGLSQIARAHIWNQSLIENKSKWLAKDFWTFLKSEKITHTSLVPTQLYDLVSGDFEAPSHFRLSLIGGGTMGSQLFKRAADLGWNPVLTYGSTETASMVAFKDESLYKPLPHAELRVSEDGFLEINSTSLMSGYWDGSEIYNIVQDGWYKSDDLAVQRENGFEILGRSSDYAKVNGEGVYLSRLQSVLQDCLLDIDLPSEATLNFMPSARRGHEVHLFTTFNPIEAEILVKMFNEKVLPFERIHECHYVNEIPRTELGKVKNQELR
jgi:o-succinylbenzoate---CoA ligase